MTDYKSTCERLFASWDAYGATLAGKRQAEQKARERQMEQERTGQQATSCSADVTIEQLTRRQ